MIEPRKVIVKIEPRTTNLSVISFWGRIKLKNSREKIKTKLSRNVPANIYFQAPQKKASAGKDI